MTTGVSAVAIGLFLLAVWIAGLSLHAQAWLTWLDGAGALAAFLVASIPSAPDGAGGRWVISMFVSGALFALWIIGLLTGADAWLVWCTFAAACATALVALGGVTRTVSRPT